MCITSTCTNGLTSDQMTLLYNLIEASKDSSYWTDDALIQAIIGIWFGVSHQPWIVRPCKHGICRKRLKFQHQNLHFVFLELCSRPEYVKLIREEISYQESLDYNGLSNLPILDSFIKESVRMNPLDKSEQLLECCGCVAKSSSVYPEKGFKTIQILKWRSFCCCW